jgi:RecA-family ATPase
MQLLSLADLAKRPPRTWLVEGLLVADSLACLYGPPASGKTFFALGLALSIAAGLPCWQGKPVISSGQQDMVIYVAGEGTAGLAARISAWCEHHGVPHDQICLFCAPVAVNLSSAAEVASLAVTIVNKRDAQGRKTQVRLVVFDTLARCSVGLDENSSQEVGRVVDNVDKLRLAVGGPAVLLLHHSGKSASGMRGSSALLSAADTALSLRMISPAVVCMHIVKQKDGEADTHSTHAMRSSGKSLVCVPTVCRSPPSTGLGEVMVIKRKCVP